MTLILTVATPIVVVQVGDRLVSKSVGGKLSPLDEIATKQVLYRAKDAVVSIGYSGQAVLGGVPTDEVIAAFLSGDPDLGRRNLNERRGIFRGRPTNRWPMNHATGHLLKKLGSLLSVGQRLQLCIAGFKLEAGAVRPLIKEFSIHPNGTHKAAHPPRHWSGNSGAWVSAIGFNHEHVVGAIVEELKHQRPAPDELAAFLTEQIRKCGGPGIGPHTSAITIHRDGPATSEFFPLAARQDVFFVGYARQEIEMNATYHPWIIGWSAMMPPTKGAGGDITFDDEGLGVLLKGSGPVPKGILSVLGSVPRLNPGEERL
ncbi:hypothetical protein EJ076_05785 [Mesorhizobium sp. M7D.F.Ca.US.005.01.1.1]|uniref:hypothetical protein n=1 Tax=Mesorhizobium sp. M7D.F.Ca.US.005.01.1.1 TaxID=2493678 RepID=UPI000F75E627|nr:hypothetical protein [Mesorhizobium sp. M7D.F.Ca.US.005.01.1.1]AZO40669.1 hypothetical protein EJ076_05785 [Mesorhizobium sp. M7D.F.Ca.US.005.01.1.1]